MTLHPSINHSFEGASGAYYTVAINPDSTGRAFLHPMDRETPSDGVPLTFRSGLYEDIAGKPYRWSRVIHDHEFAGLNLAEVLQ